MIEVLITGYLDDESVAVLAADFPSHYDPTRVDFPTPHISGVTEEAHRRVSAMVVNAVQQAMRSR